MSKNLKITPAFNNKMLKRDINVAVWKNKYDLFP